MTLPFRSHRHYRRHTMTPVAQAALHQSDNHTNAGWFDINITRCYGCDARIFPDTGHQCQRQPA